MGQLDVAIFAAIEQAELFHVLDHALPSRGYALARTAGLLLVGYGFWILNNLGLMRNTSSQIRDIQGADVWVMDPSVQFIEDITPLEENDLFRVRGVPGVKWAVPLFKAMASAQMESGNFKDFSVIGLDDQTLVGAPAEMLIG